MYRNVHHNNILNFQTKITIYYINIWWFHQQLTTNWFPHRCRSIKLNLKQTNFHENVPATFNDFNLHNLTWTSLGITCFNYSLIWCSLTTVTGKETRQPSVRSRRVVAETFSYQFSATTSFTASTSSPTTPVSIN